MAVWAAVTAVAVKVAGMAVEGVAAATVVPVATMVVVAVVVTVVAAMAAVAAVEVSANKAPLLQRPLLPSQRRCLVSLIAVVASQATAGKTDRVRDDEGNKEAGLRKAEPVKCQVWVSLARCTTSVELMYLPLFDGGIKTSALNARDE